VAPPAAHPLPLGSSSAQRQAAVCWPSTLEEFSEPPAAAGSAGSRSSRKLGGPARQRSFYVAPSLDDEDDEEAMLMEGASVLRERQRSASCSDLGRLAAGALAAGALAAGAGAAGPSSGAEPDAGCSGSQQRPQQQLDAADGDPALAATNTAAAADPTALAAAAQGPEARQRLLSSCTIDDLPIEVKPGLYIGSMLAERNRRRLRGTKITDILQVAEGLYPNHPLHFNYMNLQVRRLPGFSVASPKAWLEGGAGFAQAVGRAPSARTPREPDLICDLTQACAPRPRPPPPPTLPTGPGLPRGGLGGALPQVLRVHRRRDRTARCALVCVVFF